MRHLRSAMALSVAATAFTLGVASWPAAAAGPYTFSFIEQANDFTGTGPANSTITIKIFDGASEVDSTSATTDGSGNFQTFFAGAGHMQPGWKLKAISGVSVVRTLTIPNVTARVDRVSDVVTGVAPGHQTLRLQAFDCTMIETCTLRATRHPTTAANGHYRVDVTSGFNIRGNDEVLVRYTTSKGDQVTAQTLADEFGLDPADNVVFGCVGGSQDVVVKLLTSPGGTRMEKHTIGAVPGGSCFSRDFSAAFSSGRQLTASFASDAKVTIPNTAITISDTVATARCLPSRPILVDWFSDITHHVSGTAHGSGKFSWDFATEDPSAVTSGLEIRVQCETANGDRLEFRRTLPS